MEKTEFEKLSPRTKTLLKEDEGLYHDFKQSLSGLEAADLVAFANSESGGTILIGVKEVKLRSGKKKGEIIGCKIGDDSKHAILSKASSCRPPIKVHIYTENVTTNTPVLRIEIPPGEFRPYCTGGGTYKLRENGQNMALTPPLLLNWFTKLESEKFIGKFREATKVLENSIQEINGLVSAEMDKIRRSVELVEKTVIKEISAIESDVSSTDSATSNIESQVEDVNEYVSNTYDLIRELHDDMNTYHSSLEMKSIEQKINLLLDSSKIERPEVLVARQCIKSMVDKRTKENKGKLLTTKDLKDIANLFPMVSRKEKMNWIKEQLTQSYT